MRSTLAVFEPCVSMAIIGRRLAMDDVQKTMASDYQRQKQLIFEIASQHPRKMDLRLCSALDRCVELLRHLGQKLRGARPGPETGDRVR